MITLLRRRAQRSFSVHRAPRPPQDGILVVEHEFEGGPFAGRRMTGFASVFDMQVAYSDRGKRPRLVVRAAREARGGDLELEWGLDNHVAMTGLTLRRMSTSLRSILGTSDPERLAQLD